MAIVTLALRRAPVTNSATRCSLIGDLAATRDRPASNFAAQGRRAVADRGDRTAAEAAQSRGRARRHGGPSPHSTQARSAKMAAAKPAETRQCRIGRQQRAERRRQRDRHDHLRSREQKMDSRGRSQRAATSDSPQRLDVQGGGVQAAAGAAKRGSSPSTRRWPATLRGDEFHDLGSACMRCTNLAISGLSVPLTGDVCQSWPFWGHPRPLRGAPEKSVMSPGSPAARADHYQRIVDAAVGSGLEKPAGPWSLIATVVRTAACATIATTAAEADQASVRAPKT